MYISYHQILKNDKNNKNDEINELEKEKESDIIIPVTTSPIHATIEHFISLLNKPAIRYLKSSLIPFVLSNYVKYEFPKMCILTKNTFIRIVNKPDHFSNFTSIAKNPTSSDLVVFRDYRLLSPESFEQYDLLFIYLQYFIHEIVSSLKIHYTNPNVELEIEKIFTKDLDYVQILYDKNIKFHEQYARFPLQQYAEITHSLIASINGQEGRLSDLLSAYIMGADLVPILDHKKRKIYDHVSDDRLFSSKTRKKARFNLLLL